MRLYFRGSTKPWVEWNEAPPEMKRFDPAENQLTWADLDPTKDPLHAGSPLKIQTWRKAWDIVTKWGDPVYELV